MTWAGTNAYVDVPDSVWRSERSTGSDSRTGRTRGWRRGRSNWRTGGDRSAREDLDQRLHVGERIAGRVLDDVELLGAEYLAQLIMIGPVGVEPTHRTRRRGLA